MSNLQHQISVGLAFMTSNRFFVQATALGPRILRAETAALCAAAAAILLWAG